MVTRIYLTSLSSTALHSSVKTLIKQSMPILPSGTPIDAEWLGEQLGLRVEGLEIEPLGGPQGFTSNTMRLRPRGPSDDLP